MQDAAKTSWCYVADAGSIPLREGRRVVYGEHQAAVFNLGSTYYAVDNRCPHKQGPLADGIVSGAAVYCPLHNWKIDLGSGCALSGGEGRVRTYPVRIADDKIYVDFEEPQ